MGGNLHRPPVIPALSIVQEWQHLPRVYLRLMQLSFSAVIILDMRFSAVSLLNKDGCFSLQAVMIMSAATVVSHIVIVLYSYIQ